MKLYFIISIVLISILNLFAGEIEEKLTVTSIGLNNQKNMYRITFREKAAFYKSEIRWFKCLQYSARTNLKINVFYDPISMRIKNCNILK